MDQLRITIVQTNPEWENPLKNRAYFSEIINNLNEPTHFPHDNNHHILWKKKSYLTKFVF